MERVVSQSGQVVERQAAEGVPMERAMRSHEMLLKLVNRKGAGVVKDAVAKALQEFLQGGGSSSRPGEEGENEASRQGVGQSSAGATSAAGSI
mmetsp:Transcript_8121/g.23066  ORF Transcript_8121/g.23066 Transcript_8121/m.23066 type:complete len:93 (-) Transcript_8121:207-485(-)